MDWNQRYVEDDIPWDKGGPSPVLQWILHQQPTVLPTKGNAMVPGCGLGHDAYLLASHGHPTVGVDLSETAIVQARSLYRHPLLNWRVGDLFTDLPEGFVDGIWEYTCYCAIQPDARDAYIRAMHRALRPEGLLVGIFLLDSGNPPNEGPPFSTDLEDLNTRFATGFEFEWDRWPPVSSPGWENRERLMCWRKRSA